MNYWLYKIDHLCNINQSANRDRLSLFSPRTKFTSCRTEKAWLPLLFPLLLPTQMGSQSSGKSWGKPHLWATSQQRFNHMKHLNSCQSQIHWRNAFFFPPYWFAVLLSSWSPQYSYGHCYNTEILQFLSFSYLSPQSENPLCFSNTNDICLMFWTYYLEHHNLIEKKTIIVICFANGQLVWNSCSSPLTEAISHRKRGPHKLLIGVVWYCVCLEPVNWDTIIWRTISHSTIRFHRTFEFSIINGRGSKKFKNISQKCIPLDFLPLFFRKEKFHLKRRQYQDISSTRLLGIQSLSIILGKLWKSRRFSRQILPNLILLIFPIHSQHPFGKLVCLKHCFGCLLSKLQSWKE